MTERLEDSDFHSTLSLVDLLLCSAKQPLLGLNEAKPKLKHEHTLGLTPQLSSLKLICRRAGDLHAVLIHRCAAELQFLDIGVGNPRVLFYDADDNAVVYPNMRDLRLSGVNFDSSATRFLVPDVVPFPRLRSLRLRTPFFLGDDVLFRGNNATLEYLYFKVDAESMTMLCNSQAFGKGFSNLRNIVVEASYGSGSLRLVPERIVSDFLCKLAHSAHRMELRAAIPFAGLLTSTSCRPHFAHIRSLDLFNRPLSLYEMLNMLMSLPVLKNLSSEIGNLGSQFDHIPHDELPDHIASTYLDAGKHLKCWALPCGNRRGISVAEYVMLVALACPRLRQIESLNVDTRSYHSRVTEATRSGPYSKYASRLIRLLDGIFLEQDEEVSFMNMLIDDY
ncbi:hypothetical protein GGI00_000505 [Coemansia sp. RSA 2681]|nr:hypothetical protein GGI00_000505 [Coemansia sp. RSA 2681]